MRLDRFDVPVMRLKSLNPGPGVLPLVMDHAHSDKDDTLFYLPSVQVFRIQMAAE